MIKSILTGAFVFMVVMATAQLQTQIIGDTVRMRSNTGTAELILENSTKNVNGYLYNKGNGRTEFRNYNNLQTLTDGSTISWNVANGVNSTVTLAGTNRTLAISNPVAGQTYRIRLVQDATGSRTIGTWPANTLWPSGNAPVLSTAASSIDMVTLYYDGTNYYGNFNLLYRNTPPGVTLNSYDSKTGSSAITHSLTNVPAGALLVVTTTAGSAQTNATMTSTPLLTWTKRVDASASQSGDAEIWTAVYTAGGSINVTSSWGNQAQASVAYVITNQESSLGGATATQTYSGSTMAPSVNITTTRANSLLIAVTSDYAAVDGTNNRNYRQSATETDFYYVNNTGTFYHYYIQASTVASYNMGLNTPTTMKPGTAVIEIRGN